MYAYQPLSILSLSRILQHETMGEEARYRAYTAMLLRIIASDKRLDDKRAPSYSDEIEQAHMNPFKNLIPAAGKNEGQMIIRHLLGE